uniref:DUF1618 domain-containing protein n=1 Tax=Oryza barthii TaxID=65489 RepID=A0A0D3GW25_9ORYZ
MPSPPSASGRRCTLPAASSRRSARQFATHLPVLRDILLPAPARGNWDNFLYQFDPSYFRDVTVSRNKPMDNKPKKFKEIDRGWKATTWSMPMSVNRSSSCCCDDDWQIDCEIDDN